MTTHLSNKLVIVIFLLNLWFLGDSSLLDRGLSAVGRTHFLSGLGRGGGILRWRWLTLIFFLNLTGELGKGSGRLL